MITTRGPDGANKIYTKPGPLFLDTYPGSWSPRPSWPPSTSPCRWWRGGRTCWRSAGTSCFQPSRPPAASGCLHRSCFSEYPQGQMLLLDVCTLHRSSSSELNAHIPPLRSPDCLIDAGWSALQCESFSPQALNFAFVPQQFRVIYIATCRYDKLFLSLFSWFSMTSFSRGKDDTWCKPAHFCSLSFLWFLMKCPPQFALGEHSVHHQEGFRHGGKVASRHLYG